jgi:hypothetical protein
LITKGTIDSNFSNKNNPLVENHITDRNDYKLKWTNYLNEIYDVDTNLPNLPEEIGWIDRVDINNLKSSAQDIIVTDEDIINTFKKLKTKRKAPGPNKINMVLIKLAYETDKQ